MQRQYPLLSVTQIIIITLLIIFLFWYFWFFSDNILTIGIGIIGTLMMILLLYYYIKKTKKKRKDLFSFNEIRNEIGFIFLIIGIIMFMFTGALLSLGVRIRELIFETIVPGLAATAYGFIKILNLERKKEMFRKTRLK